MDTRPDAHENVEVTTPVSPSANTSSEDTSNKSDKSKPKPAPNIPTVEHAYNIIFDSWITPPPKPNAATTQTLPTGSW